MEQNKSPVCKTCNHLCHCNLSSGCQCNCKSCSCGHIEVQTNNSGVVVDDTNECEWCQ
jgi:hypothetical protein